MIDIKLRDKNRIVTLSVPLKTPIQSRNGSPYFYNSMELLCVAVGSCFGKELVQYCAEEKINPRTFESIKVTMENFTPRIILSHPSDMPKGILDNIGVLARNCSVAKLLRNGVEIEFIINQTSTADLVDESKNTSCCGDRNAEKP